MSPIKFNLMYKVTLFIVNVATQDPITLIVRHTDASMKGKVLYDQMCTWNEEIEEGHQHHHHEMIDFPL